MPHRASVIVLAAALAAITAASAGAEAGIGNAFGLGFGRTPRLLPVLHPLLGQDIPSDGRSYTFVARGYFKIAGKTVAKLPSFPGTSTPQPIRLSIPVSRATRHTINAAAKRSGSHRTTLTITLRTPDRTYAQDAFLTIPGR